MLSPPMTPSPAPQRDGASGAQQERQRTRADAAGGRQPTALAAAAGRPAQLAGGGGSKRAPRPAHQQQQQQQQQQLQPLHALPPLPWPPRLAQHEVERGISYYGSGDRLRAVAAKLLAGQPIKAFTMGGSVTAGTGASDQRFCYASRFFEFLNTTFPQRCEEWMSGIMVHAMGIVSLCSRIAGSKPAVSPLLQCRDHVLVNKGIGATSSGIFAACTERMVPNVRV